MARNISTGRSTFENERAFYVFVNKLENIKRMRDGFIFCLQFFFNKNLVKNYIAVKKDPFICFYKGYAF